MILECRLPSDSVCVHLALHMVTVVGAVQTACCHQKTRASRGQHKTAVAEKVRTVAQQRRRRCRRRFGALGGGPHLLLAAWRWFKVDADVKSTGKGISNTCSRSRRVETPKFRRVALCSALGCEITTRETADAAEGAVADKTLAFSEAPA